MKDYQQLAGDWHRAQGFVLRVLPQELIFLYTDIFRVPRGEMFGWLINIGHQLVGSLTEALRIGGVNGVEHGTAGMANQLPLAAIQHDVVAMPILEKAAALHASADMLDETEVQISYCQNFMAAN